MKRSEGVRRRILGAAVTAALLVFPATAPGAQHSSGPADPGGERGGAAAAAVDTAEQEADTVDLEELKRRIEALTREIEAMRLGGEVVARADTSVLGFGPAASKVYKVGQGVSIGGYGEVLYENYAEELENGAPSGATDRADALRGIVYVGYKFSDELLFNSEIEFEHGSTGSGGSASLEFAYIDYRFFERVGARAGLLLIPVGFINELHEPPVFLGTERTVTESRIIPTTWRENGIGVFGDAGDFSYRAYVVNGLDAGGFDGGGLRGGRQKGAKAAAEDFAVTGRVDWTGVRGLTVGASVYAGGSGQGRSSPGNPDDEVVATTTIWEGHAEYRAHGLSLRGLYATATVDAVTALNQLNELTGSATIGEELRGGYVEAGYDVLRNAATEHQLVPYVRWETVNTQAEVPEGFSADPANDDRYMTLGLQWKPVPQVVAKTDYRFHSDEAESGLDQFNVAIGYLF